MFSEHSARSHINKLDISFHFFKYKFIVVFPSFVFFIDFLTPCYENGIKGVVKYNSHGAYEIVNPTLNSTYTFLQEFLAEVKDVFPDEFIHLGMDETYHACW